MHSPNDVHLSLRKWLGLALPAPWDVQPKRDENAQRPSAFIIPASMPSNTGSAYVREMAQDFDIFAYPPGVEGDPGASKQEAFELAQMLDRAMTEGLMVGSVDYSFTMRVPVFDYAGVGPDEGQPPDAEPYDYLPVSQWGTDARVDPEDDTLYTVVGSLRVRWHRMGDTRRFRGAVLEDVRVSHQPS